MRAAVVLCRDLDIFVSFVTVRIAILDAQIREVDLFIEVGQVVLACPFADLLVGPIRLAVVVGAVVIALVQPLLVLPLELVVEHHAFEVSAAPLQTRRGALVRAVDLNVVGQLALAFDAMPKGLAAIVVAIAVALQQAMALLR